MNNNKFSNLKRILIVEDEALILEMMKELLESEGYKVNEAKNGKEALDKIKLSTYDLILSDLLMPQMNGEELYYEVKKIAPDLVEKFVFVTGSSANIRDLMNRTGCQYLLQKPFRLEELRNIVKKILSE